ncbi:MAG: LLM class flavin-dependent oxidoreductase [Myxococcales bacterium]|nr:LLM class flavin-dependent oxidoreductase [Myxococcales bacterium]
MSWGVAFAWHVHPWEELLELVRRAEALGYAAAFVDGDISMLGERTEADALDGWTVTTALLAQTQRIPIGSMRLVEHWNAAHLAQAVATAERLAPGRLRFLISIGDRKLDAHFGFPRLPAAERSAWLDETLTAVRALWRGETVTLRGRHVHLDSARVRPTPPGGRIPIAIAARGPRTLDLVAAHADVWDVNLPPVAARVRRAEARLEAACRRCGRDPSAIARSMWIFTRVGEGAATSGTLKEFRRLNPWFAAIPDSEVKEALVVGRGEHCRERLHALAAELGLDLPVVDLSGLSSAATREALEALAPGK